ncbi:MAG: hypothetical protein MUC67_07860 [Acidobacteria bacterium]|jgi:hypothetical protein|nr:hypothetical protein [Acidobacteriota bacterium]MCU0253745.1 hypothetical protein [Acidobacteriota bacterium]
MKAASSSSTTRFSRGSRRLGNRTSGRLFRKAIRKGIRRVTRLEIAIRFGFVESVGQAVAKRIRDVFYAGAAGCLVDEASVVVAVG